MLLKNIFDFFKIKKSGLFDEKYYIFTYEDVRKSDVHPLWHFVTKGWKEGRNPNKFFNMKNFLNQSFIKKNVNPLIDIINNVDISLCFEDSVGTYNCRLEKYPLVSIIILTHNGIDYIKNLLTAIKNNTYYYNYEIIVVDNASTDGTLNYLYKMKKKLPLVILENDKNESFSEANNKAVKIAKGELLVFLNNDTRPLKGWLCELVKEYVSNPMLGSAGPKLIYPYKRGFNNSCKIQHVGIQFNYEGNFYRPYNMGNGKNIDEFNEKAERACLTAACLLVPKKVFNEVGGFDEKYVYGYEDVDLGLKILKAGYKNIYIPTSLVYHYEFGTQRKDSNNLVFKRRRNNILHFTKKWHHYIKKHYWKDKINGNNFFCSPMHIAFAVSNKGQNVAEGDYFTALELGEEFKKFGWKVSFLSKNHNEWYSFNEDIDVLIVMLDSYNLNKLPNFKKKILKIAWVRNWFDRWVKNPSFSDYDLILSSGKTGCEYLKNFFPDKEIIFFPIATNEKRFKDKVYDKNFECDYCFTGNYWNDERDIIKYLNPLDLNYSFHIYGKNWDKVKKFKKFYKGFVKYEDIPKVYSNTKLVIDDANRVTKPYGSVNSRVYDALGAGVLVITNGDIGSKEVFDGRLPIYKDQKSLNELIRFYLSNVEARKALVKELRDFVLQHHTYRQRALFFKKILEDRFLKKSIVIKLPVPSEKVKNEWGDYHFGVSIEKEFKKCGFKTKLQMLNEWDNDKDMDYDIVLVLRGLSKYELKPYHFNIMWNISHPNKIDYKEYLSYDFVYIASLYWSEFLKEKLKVDYIDVLLQCTDIEKFKKIEVNKDIDILFVGNSRNVYRKIIKDLLPCKYNVYIYGSKWEQFIDKKYLKGHLIPNDKLFLFYNRAKIVLNDHWDDMKEKGFISNRIFDVAACGGFVITDYVRDLEKVFGNNIVWYLSKNDLHDKIDFFMQNENLREELANNAMNIVRNNHTFFHRVSKMIDMINERVYWWEK